MEFQPQYVRGVPFPPWHNRKHIEEAMDYFPHDDDIVISSYPKSGSTWLRYIVVQILSKGKCFPSFDDLSHKDAPSMHLVGAAGLESIQGPRIYKHHFPHSIAHKNPKAKFIYIYRRPEDTLVSFYHYLNDMEGRVSDLNQFVEDFVSGNIAYGSYFKNVLSHVSSKSDNMLLVSYESLNRNRGEEILRLAKFVGGGCFEALSNNAGLLEDILYRTSFDYMKENLSVARKPFGVLKSVNFFRKGIVGDGKNSLLPEHLKKLYEVAEDVLKGTDVLEEWSRD